MVRNLAAFALLMWPAGIAYAQPFPVGDFEGEFEFIPADSQGDGRGGRLRTGNDGGVGSYTLDTGETLTLESGSGAVGFARRPSIIAGGNGGIGTIEISNSSTLSLQGNNGAPSIFIGEEGEPDDISFGLFSVLSGSNLVLQDLQLLDVDPNINARGVSILTGRDFGNGTLLVDDATLTMESSSRVRMGVADEANATGQATFQNGAIVRLEEFAVPGATPNGVDLSVGIGSGNGTINVSDSSFLLRSNAERAFAQFGFEGGLGALNIDNAEMEMEGLTDSELVIGNRGVGVADIKDGSVLSITAGVGRASLGLGRTFGDAETASGIVSITGGASATVNGGDWGEVQVGERIIADGALSTATLNITGTGSTLSASDRVTIGKESGAGTTVATVNVSSGGTLVSPTIDVFEGGAIVGSGGTLLGDVHVYAGGALSPGLSPGLLTIDGNLTLGADSALFIEFEGDSPDMFDSIDVSGDLVVEGMFDLILDFTSYSPIDGMEFSFLTVGENLDSDFLTLANISVLGLGADSFFSLTKNSSTGGVDLVATSVAPVPVPLPALMLLTGLLGFSALRKKRRTVLAHTC